MPSNNQLPRSTPEAQGITSSAVLGFVQAVEQRGLALHSLMLLRHGHVVAEGWWQPYAPDTPHMMFSLSKSFTSTAVGFAVEEGLLSVDDPVLSFFPDEAPAAPSDNLKAMRVRHLLAMSTGHVEDTVPRFYREHNSNWVEAFFAVSVEREPGTHFLYNTGATYMLSAIVQKLTGKTLLEYLEPRLFAPLGITGATWESSPQGINTGGWGLSVTTEDIANFGQLYLQQGMWNGQQIVPAAWIAEATRFHTDNSSSGENVDWQQGYGYQFWRCRHNAYRGDGAFGQFCVVMPDQDAVLAITSGLAGMQDVLNLVWEHLLPAMQSESLTEDNPARAALTEKLASLALPPQAGQPSSSLAAQISGTTYRMDANDLQIETMRFDFDEEGKLIIQNEYGTHQIVVGNNRWAHGVSNMWTRGTASLSRLDGTLQPVAASGAWISDDAYVVQLCYTATPSLDTFTARFAANQLLLNVQRNVSFGPTEWPQIVGHADK